MSLGKNKIEVNRMQKLRRKKESIQALKKRVAVTGFFAGLIWTSLWSFLAYFNFTELSPSTFFLETWNGAAWVDSWTGQLFSILISSLLSIAVAYLYYALFRNLTGMLPGLVFGVVIWVILILSSSSLFVHIPFMNELDIDTIVTTLSILMIYGVFIGYTISYDFLDQPSN